MRRPSRRLLALVPLIALAACGGGGARALPGASSSTAGAAASAAAESVNFSIAIPSSVPAASVRRVPAYISTNTGYVTVTVSPAPGGVAQPQAISCTPAGAPTTCSGAVMAPPGTDTFTVNLYAANQTTLLSTGQSTVNVTAPNQTVSLTFNPVLASLTLQTPALKLNAGTASTTSVTVTAFDPSGATIVAQPTVSPAPAFVDANGNALTVNLAITNVQPTNGTGTLTFPGGASTLSLTAPPSSPILLSYNGYALLSASVGPAAAPGVAFTINPSTVSVRPSLQTFTAGTAVPQGIAAGPDGNVWFAARDAIGKIVPPAPGAANPSIANGGITLYALTANSYAAGITTWNGKLWFAENAAIANKIGAITTAGTGLTQLAVPTAASGPTGVTVGSDGNLYFTEALGNKVGYVSATTTTITECAAAFSAPYGIVSGPDGNIWVVQNGNASVAKLTVPGGSTCTLASGSPFAIPSGSNDQWIASNGSSLYVTQPAGSLVPLATSGTFGTAITTPTGSKPTQITLGPDGLLYVMSDAGATPTLLAINPTTLAVTTYALAAGPATPATDWVTAGPDGNIWFTEQVSGQIGELIL